MDLPLKIGYILLFLFIIAVAYKIYKDDNE
jgi:hypothetical protein